MEKNSGNDSTESDRDDDDDAGTSSNVSAKKARVSGFQCLSMQKIQVRTILNT